MAYGVATSRSTKSNVTCFAPFPATSSKWMLLCPKYFSATVSKSWRDPALLFDRAKLRVMAVVNGDIMIRSVLLQIGFMSFLFLGAGFGDTTLAANQVLIQFLFITSYAMDGFAFAAEALIGQALGARNRAALRRGVMVTSFWAAVVVGVLTGAHSQRELAGISDHVLADISGVTALLDD